MSFLDNLENSLKSLEGGSEREDAGREHDRRKADRERQMATGPWAEQLKKSPYASELMTVATREGFRQRTKVYITWIGDILRLDAKEKRLELRPTPQGIEAVSIAEGKNETTVLVDLKSAPAELIRHWLG